MIIKDIMQAHQHSVKPLYVNTVILQMMAFCFIQALYSFAAFWESGVVAYHLRFMFYCNTNKELL